MRHSLKPMVLTPNGRCVRGLADPALLGTDSTNQAPGMPWPRFYAQEGSR